MNNVNPIRVDLPQEIFAIAIEANYMQNSRWWESKCRNVERLQFQVWEYVCAVVAKMCKKYHLK